MNEEAFDRKQANTHLNNVILNVLEEELPDLKARVKVLCREVKKAKYIVYGLSIALFLVGILFVAAALAISLADELATYDSTLQVLGFGSASAASFISLMLLHPIKKVQKVNSDAGQAEMVYQSWHLEISLFIRAMDISERTSIEQAARNIRESTRAAIQLLEQYAEKPATS
ncbi:MAG: hypothetical protein KGY55_03630 [Candidatus Thermoplasmatota archaeon]|nr:hypothetical protein [Candidatus Thermoplasmatota archaeon]